MKKAEEKKDTKGAANEPESKLTNLKDNSASPAEMREMRGDKGASKLAATADTQAQIDKEDAKRHEDEDVSVYGRLSRSGYVLNDNQLTGERWVGESIQHDPDADMASKLKTRVTPIAEVRPWRGLQVRPKDGEPFVVGDEVDRDTTPAYWLSLLIPGTKKNFIEA